MGDLSWLGLVFMQVDIEQGIATTTVSATGDATSVTVSIDASANNVLSFSNRVCIRLRNSGPYFEIGSAALSGGGTPSPLSD